MESTPNLSLPYIMPSQAQKHVTHNEAIRALDAIVQLSVTSRTLTVPPASPAEGDRYIVASGASGVWSGQEGTVAAYQDAAWAFYSANEGWRAWVADEAKTVILQGSSWTDITGEFDTVSVNGAVADATNRISANSAAVLLNHDGAGHQLKINKNSASDIGSILFQTGFSGRAEFGLTGDDDWHVKVSADGSTWTDALVANAGTGSIGIGAAASTYQLEVSGNQVDLFGLFGYENTATGVGINFAKARGSATSPAIVQSGDTLGVIRGWGYDGSSFEGVTNVQTKVGTVSSGNISGRLIFKTTDTTGTMTIRMTLEDDGRVTTGGPVVPQSYTVATLPSASSSGAGAIAYVTDETGGSTVAFSDGTNWRRVADRATVS